VRQPLELREDASVLEVACELRDASGVRPAHEVISGVGGNLGPPPAATEAGGVGSWTLRVPAFSARQTYVMLEQGPLRLAVPWHAVLRLQIVRRDAIEARAARLGVTVLPPLAPLLSRGAECPVLIVAHGLKRAWMVADRLVWRLPAEACEAGVRGKEAGLARAVSTEDGEVFALAEPRLLLAGVPMPPFPRIADAPVVPVATPAPIEVLDARWVTPLPAPGTHEEAAGQVREEDVMDEPGTGAEAPGEAALADSAHEPAAAEGGVRRALVAEDSITARIFLTRLLEQQGFEVVAVDRASELNAALAGGAWSLVCVDVELPDARGTNLLRAVRDRLQQDAPLVALVRDDQDVAAARVAGVWRTLLKPVEPGALRLLLARIGLAERASG
jgi:CheY-like chemotaxis protein